ncbi:hypothetical protein BCR44DRAFT_217199 [Catenaria anguillulae PL171]|uniref:Uncharacterized protein n=1 Tax=Catenaria anguillulae PL171 TaxID=765915 RepID=A0A1Y2HV39_9FUNG|nr:hypothetical protein BCR44DRAFT_217199 [Catenaria anguillulae PL171]
MLLYYRCFCAHPICSTCCLHPRTFRPTCILVVQSPHPGPGSVSTRCSYPVPTCYLFCAVLCRFSYVICFCALPVAIFRSPFHSTTTTLHSRQSVHNTFELHQPVCSHYHFPYSLASSHLSTITIRRIVLYKTQYL